MEPTATALGAFHRVLADLYLRIPRFRVEADYEFSDLRLKVSNGSRVPILRRLWTADAHGVEVIVEHRHEARPGGGRRHKEFRPLRWRDPAGGEFATIPVGGSALTDFLYFVPAAAAGPPEVDPRVDPDAVDPRKAILCLRGIDRVIRFWADDETPDSTWREVEFDVRIASAVPLWRTSRRVRIAFDGRAPIPRPTDVSEPLADRIRFECRRSRRRARRAADS